MESRIANNLTLPAASNLSPILPNSTSGVGAISANCIRYAAPLPLSDQEGETITEQDTFVLLRRRPRPRACLGDDYESVFAKPRDGSDFIDNRKGDTIK